MYIIIAIAAIVIVILILLNQPAYKCSMRANYLFCPGQDSSGNNIGNQYTLVDNIPELINDCNSLNNCRGFNTNAWFKNKINLPLTTWTSDPNKGLYIKYPEKN